MQVSFLQRGIERGSEIKRRGRGGGGSIVSVHAALQLTYLWFRRERRRGKWSFSNGWATHDAIHVCCSAGLTPPLSPFIETVGQDGKTGGKNRARKKKTRKKLLTRRLHAGCNFVPSHFARLVFGCCHITDDVVICGFQRGTAPDGQQLRVCGGKTFVFIL